MFEKREDYEQFLVVKPVEKEYERNKKTFKKKFNVYKCKFCKFEHERVQTVISHLKNEHSDKVVKKIDKVDDEKPKLVKEKVIPKKQQLKFKKVIPKAKPQRLDDFPDSTVPAPEPSKEPTSTEGIKYPTDDLDPEEDDVNWFGDW